MIILRVTFILFIQCFANILLTAGVSCIKRTLLGIVETHKWCEGRRHLKDGAVAVRGMRHAACSMLLPCQGCS
ncbi:hypothetical protein F4815DRAFT_313460 [Daldinia loculata]|nr:hypothetical protein F4815DRAFT_313460 [Daldinia loculata]